MFSASDRRERVKMGSILEARERNQRGITRDVLGVHGYRPVTFPYELPVHYGRTMQTYAFVACGLKRKRG